MISVIQGFVLGFIIVLPGMSGGTLFLIFGIYEQLMRDLAKLYIRPYLPLFGGMLVGIYFGGLAFSLFFQNYRDATAAFLLGCLIASVKPVLAYCPKPDKSAIVAATIGAMIGFALVFEAIGTLSIALETNWLLLIIGGALASAAMMIPGVPGSSILIIFGIYDTMLFSIAELEVFNLSLFGVGNVLGILLLANALNVFYAKHRTLTSYFFAGLIIGSSRGLLPHSFDLLYLFLFLLGFSVVWKFSGRKSSSGEGEIYETQIATTDLLPENKVDQMIKGLRVKGKKLTRRLKK